MRQIMCVSILAETIDNNNNGGDARGDELIDFTLIQIEMRYDGVLDVDEMDNFS